MTARRGDETAPVLLDVEEAARRLGTKPRFVRRLIAERRIEFVKVGVTCGPANPHWPRSSTRAGSSR